jgi:hypothetical protein
LIEIMQPVPGLPIGDADINDSFTARDKVFLMRAGQRAEANSRKRLAAALPWFGKEGNRRSSMLARASSFGLGPKKDIKPPEGTHSADPTTPLAKPPARKVRGP